MLFAAFVLVAVDGEHDRLQQSIDLGHGNQPTEMCNVPGLRLEQEQQVSVFLRLLIVGKEALLQLGSFVEVTCDFVLLGTVSPGVVSQMLYHTYLLQRHAVLNQQCYP